VTEPLSDLSLSIYLARRLPKRHLLAAVRAQWQPNEYPASLERLYHWTPDECIPEFFTDATAFVSIHPDMPDLALPHWAGGDAARFIAAHRAMLEGPEVHLSRGGPARAPAARRREQIRHSMTKGKTQCRWG
jgi:WD repeat-containing protein 81